MEKQKKIKLKKHLNKALQEVVFNLEFSQDIIRLMPNENILLEERKNENTKSCTNFLP